MFKEVNGNRKENILQNILVYTHRRKNVIQNDRIFIFGWTIPLKAVYQIILKGDKKTHIAFMFLCLCKIRQTPLEILDQWEGK